MKPDIASCMLRLNKADMKLEFHLIEDEKGAMTLSRYNNMTIINDDRHEWRLYYKCSLGA